MTALERRPAITVAQLKALLGAVPDDYTVSIQDINFGGAWSQPSLSDFQVDAERRQFLLPAKEQQFCD